MPDRDPTEHANPPEPLPELYLTPSLTMLGSVHELTGSGPAGQDDGVTFEELGGSG